MTKIHLAVCCELRAIGILRLRALERDSKEINDIYIGVKIWSLGGDTRRRAESELRRAQDAKRVETAGAPGATVRRGCAPARE